MRRHLFLLPVIAVLLLAGGAGSVAVAGADNPVRLQTSITTSAQELYDLDFTTGACAHQDAATGRCAVLAYETDNFSGDLVGQEQSAVGLSVTLAFIRQAMGVATYSGTVKGCPGPGTAIFRYVYTMGVNGVSGHNQGMVTVVPGSGTGGLTGLRGHGDLDTTTTSGSPVSSGVLDFSCKKGRHH